jgi:hypothetical protein
MPLKYGSNYVVVPTDGFWASVVIQNREMKRMGGGFTFETDTRHGISYFIVLRLFKETRSRWFMILAVLSICGSREVEVFVF